ncbi:GPI mannosyltransferase, partial [Mycena olivaceomarginata]
MSLALDALILVTGRTHVLLAPYTKVEESFNLQAVHDVLMYGERSFYDHFVFAGAVPCTFIMFCSLAWISKPAIYLASFFGLVPSKFELKVVVRLVLASINAIGLCLIQHAISRRFGCSTGLYYTLIACSQFHVPFWMGRTLPNMFALFPVSLSVQCLLIAHALNTLKPSQRSDIVSIASLVFSAVVFRAEVAALAGALVLQPIYSGHITFCHFVSCVNRYATNIGYGPYFPDSLSAFTVSVDSYFWGQPYLWPEWHSIYFNVVEGKSADWGTSPAHAYLTSHLPKLLLSALPLSL